MEVDSKNGAWMSKSLKRTLFAVGGFMGLLILCSVAVFYFVDASAYKPWVERAASKALGMDLHVAGRLRISFLPDLHVQLDDVLLRNRGMVIASAEEVNLGIALLPMLHKEVRIRRIRLKHPRISIVCNRDGKFNFEKRKESTGKLFAPVLDDLSLTDGVFLYRDESSGADFVVENFNLDMRSLRLSGGNKAERLKNLSFDAELSCREIRTKGLLFSDVKTTCQGKDGIFTLKPLTMNFFGGQGVSSIVADFSGPVPRYFVRSTLSKFRIEEYLKTGSSKKVAAGVMDFSATLSMQGSTAKEIKQSAEGVASLRGKNLTLYGRDLDREFARYESSQNFNLVDAGAFFFAGPIGLAVTKGYNFVSIAQGSGGSNNIRELLAEWTLAGGVAQAKDVAMATKQNRVALQGRINFVKERFDDVTIALIDAQGCVRVEQKLRGTFQKPLVEKPNILMTLAGPTINLFKQTRDFLTGGKCKLFYTGSVEAPQ